MYIRKTHDEWEIWGNEGYGYDFYCTCSSYAEAKSVLKDYRENCKGYFYIKKVRVKNDPE